MDKKVTPCGVWQGPYLLIRGGMCLLMITLVCTTLLVHEKNE